MNVKEAVKQFISAHKPDRIDVDYIVEGYGSVEEYMECGAWMGDLGEYQLEISGFDTKSGRPEIINWFADEAFQIAWFELPYEERRQPEDHVPWTVVDEDLVCAIRHARQQINKGKYDVSLVSLENGEPAEDLCFWIDQR